MPNFGETFLDKEPKDYSSIFTLHKSQKDKICFKDIPEFNELYKFVRNKKYLSKKIDYFSSSKKDGTHLFLAVISQANKYVHNYGTTRYSIKRFRNIAGKYINYLFQEKATLDIYIPILLTNFEFNSFAINENIQVVRMDDIFQLSRQTINGHGSGVHKTVLGCATHCLKLQYYNFSYENVFDIVHKTSNINAYPLDTIDQFFASIRICLGIDTGYAQLISKLIDVEEVFAAAKLIELHGTSLRAYPSKFDNYAWNESVPSISREGMKKIKKIYLKLLENGDKKIELSVDRINRSFLRNHHEDSFLDDLIGLESLLTDDSKDSLKYKLSLRLAFLLSSNGEKNKNYKKIVSHLYDYRSAIVHGEKDKDKKRFVTIDGTKYDCNVESRKYVASTMEFILLNYDSATIKELSIYLDKCIFDYITDKSC